MTNLKGPRQQEALLQVPPSQKETAGVCHGGRFHARPRADQTEQKKKEDRRN